MECNGCEFRPELYYDDEYQIWVRREEDGTLTVGMTDLSQTIAGKILSLRVRRPGTQRPAGKPVATIESGKWAGPIPNVFDCEIIEGNEEALEDPALLNIEPYDTWIVRVKPVNGADSALEKLKVGDEAKEGYCKRAREDDIHCERNVR
ncbi:MAG: glycine cleavage system protein H [Pseudomonadota bacterium]